MASKRGPLLIVFLAAATAAIVAFFAFRSPIEQGIATQSARSAFSSSKLNLLVLGYQDDENTTDSIVLAHLDVDRRTATLVSIPRDTWVAIPHHGHQKINSAYAFGGARTSGAIISSLLGGIPIDATIALQPEGAAQIVDAMGGLNVDVDEDMDYDDNYGNLHIHLKKGEHYLTGSQVVGYMRFRHDLASDFGRVARQRQVLKRMLDQLSSPQYWVTLPRILQFARKDVKTSLSDRQLAALITIYRDVPDENIRGFTLPCKAGWVGDASVVFADDRWAKLIGTVLFGRADPPQDPVVVVDATGVDPAFDKTAVGLLRGAGWNVPTFIDEPAKAQSVALGNGPAIRALARIFGTSRTPASKGSFVFGTDLAPAGP